MAAPMKNGCQVLVEYVEKPSGYAMRTTDIYKEYYGIGFILSGDRQITTPERSYFVHAGNLSLMDIGIYHRTFSLSNAPYKRYGIKFTPKIAERCIAQIGEANFKKVMSYLCYELPLQTQLKVRQMYEDMLYEYEHYDANSEFIIEGILGRLIVTILRDGKHAESASANLNIQDEIINNILDHIDLHYAENPSVDELARLAGLSPSHFMKRFHDCVGSSYKTYLNCQKTRIAQDLLVNTRLPITRISDELGFCNSNYFCNIFHKITGMSPSDYRKSRLTE